MHRIVRWLTVFVLVSRVCGREDRSLANTFPFSLTEDIGQSTFSRQLEEDLNKVDFNSVAAASAAGQRCIDKIIVEEETEYDEVYECNHSYNKRCHTSYTTTYNAQQEEECEENYKKKCFIQYTPTAYNATVQICREQLVKDCSQEGPVVCSTEYTSECETTQHEHQVEDDVAECRSDVETKCNDVTSGYTTSQECSNWPIQRCSVNKKTVTKYTPQTACKKVPVEICGPSACPVIPGPPQCYETTKTITSEKPEEECSLEPRQACKHVTKLVPQLKPKESCLDVPKEVCTRSLNNPRKVSKPVVKKWCYTPTEESGLDSLSDFGNLPDNQGRDPVPSPTTSRSCPRSCEDAKRRGVCDPRCNTYSKECGVPPCQSTTTTTPRPVPTCPSSCRPGFQNNGVCEPQCNVPLCGYDPDCNQPVCPSSCRPGFQSNGRCEPQCDVPECNFDPDCNAPPPYNPPAPVVTTPAYRPPAPRPTPRPTPPPTRPPTRPTPPACPSVCRPGFQSNGRCEVPCHIPECGYDPDCNKPVKEPENVYLPPERGACPPGGCGGRSSAGIRGLAPPSRRAGRINKAKINVEQARGRPRQRSRGAGESRNSSPARNNWDLYLKSGLIQRKG